MEYLKVYDETLPLGNRMAGKNVVVINRSEIVGRPLAAMLANDGADVYSVDLNGVFLMRRGKMLEVGARRPSPRPRARNRLDERPMRSRTLAGKGGGRLACRRRRTRPSPQRLTQPPPLPCPAPVSFPAGPARRRTTGRRA
jgi:hypothetical protein